MQYMKKEQLFTHRSKIAFFQWVGTPMLCDAVSNYYQILLCKDSMSNFPSNRMHNKRKCLCVWHVGGMMDYSEPVTCSFLIQTPQRGSFFFHHLSLQFLKLIDWKEECCKRCISRCHCWWQINFISFLKKKICLYWCFTIKASILRFAKWQLWMGNGSSRKLSLWISHNLKKDIEPWYSCRRVFNSNLWRFNWNALESTWNPTAIHRFVPISGVGESFSRGSTTWIKSSITTCVNVFFYTVIAI